MAKRRLDGGERALWEKVIAEVKPLGTGSERINQSTDLCLPILPVKRIRQVGRKKFSPSANVIETNGLSGMAEQTVTMEGDPRQIRHVRRGRREIDARLDLHGMRQEQAYVALQNFLMVARARKDRTLLVITGKGARETIYASFSMVRRGVLRHRFLEWVDGPFREHIASVAPAHPRHGGSGAFYVLLKRT